MAAPLVYPLVVTLGTVAGYVLRFSVAWLWRGLAFVLTGITGTLVARVLLALGFALVGFKGMDIAVNELKMRVVSSSSSLPADVFNLFLLAGGGYCLNMLFGAISFRLAYWAATKSTQVLGVKA